MQTTINTANGYVLEDIVQAVLTVLQPTTPEAQPIEEPDEYVLKNTVKRYKGIEDYPDLMKVNDVKEYLRIGTNAAYDLMNHPKCPVFRVGSSLRIRKEKLLQFISEWESGFVEVNL